ncbi:MAG TPA: hypothetical protein VKB76_17990, partial [Ktedonobacterales bacterium]|nr:hypothetical protein [Ktedonobacterales bacterium]
RAAYQTAIDGLDGVFYRLAMLRALRPPKGTPLTPAPARAAVARIMMARKPRQRWARPQTKLYDRTGDEITLDEIERITV